MDDEEEGAVVEPTRPSVALDRMRSAVARLARKHAAPSAMVMPTLDAYAEATAAVAAAAERLAEEVRVLQLVARRATDESARHAADVAAMRAGLEALLACSGCGRRIEASDRTVEAECGHVCHERCSRRRCRAC